MLERTPNVDRIKGVGAVLLTPSELYRSVERARAAIGDALTGPPDRFRTATRFAVQLYRQSELWGWRDDFERMAVDMAHVEALRITA